jgi:eukaryotic-like serine/threonine-protein kinase
MQTFKLFVSSPGDVMVERRRVDKIVSRLNGEFASVAQLETIRWETEFYQAYSTFQSQIPRSTDCDLVIGILRWRLGTELPSDFAEKLPDDRPFPSGTAYEILAAVERRQKGSKLPDIYVFRFGGGSPPVPLDDPDRAKIERDWQALKGFIEEWFLTERGHFKAAFNQYSSEDDFEAQLEKLLRRWVADKVAGGRVVRWPIAVKGSPFCGLGAFGAKHAPVFFGRGDDISRAVDLWREVGGRGSPYLLVVGASGAGKSSLMRAGLVPRLTTPGVIKEVDAWRVAVMRPGDSSAGPFAALATALMHDEATLPKEEQGRGPALPEIGQGDSQTPAELAPVLQHADAAAIKPIINALSRVGATEHDRENYRREVRCDLVLCIDQYEELFAASVSDAERSAFIDLVAALVGTGRVWVAATLRSDFYARMIDQPILKKLKELGATYDLAPPGPVELADIIRSPAEAAGLVFDTYAASGERLDARLLRDADRPDMLPLVQLALSRLFEGRETAPDDGIILPVKAYESLGGLKGIVNEAGEKAIASLGEAEKAQLARLLRQLAVPAARQDGIGEGALTIRAMPLRQIAPEGDELSRKLISALTSARLLTATGTAGDAQVRLTHQRVLEDWNRARTIVTESGDFYRIRADLEESLRKWEAGKCRKELLLARGLPLAEAASIISKYGAELPPEALAYVRASRQRAQRAQMVGWGLAAFFFLLAVAASGTGILAYREQQAAVRAEQQAEAALTAATKTANGLLIDLVNRFRTAIGVPAMLIKDILDKALALQQQLIQSGQLTPDLKFSEAAALEFTVESRLTIGDTTGALAAAEQALQICTDLVAANPNNTTYQVGLAAAHEKVGDVQTAQGKLAQSLVSYQAESVIFDRLVKSNPSNAVLQRALLTSYVRVGDAQGAQGKLADALAAYQADLAIAERWAKSDPDDADWQHQLSIAYERVGDIQVEQGKLADALVTSQADLALSKRLAKSYPGNADLQHGLSISYEKVGDVQMAQGKLAEALASYQAEFDIMQRLAKSDPGNAGWQRSFSICYEKVGDAQKAQGELADALGSYLAYFEIMQRLAKSDPRNADWQRGLSISYEKVGDVQMAQGKLADALASYQAYLELKQRLAKSSPGNTDWQRGLSVAYGKLGDLYSKEHRADGAINNYKAALAIIQHLIALNSTNAQWQADLVEYNYDLAMNGDDTARRFSLVLEQLKNLQANRDLSNEQKGWMRNAEAALAKAPPH